MIFVAVMACAVAGSRVELEPDWQVDSIADGWTKSSAAAVASGPIRVTLALKEDNVPALLALLDKTSDPLSASYGKHLSLEELRSLVYVRPSRRAAVRKWLLGENARIIADDQHVGFIVAELEVKDAERAFGVKLIPFAHAESGEVGFPFPPFPLSLAPPIPMSPTPWYLNCSRS
jgi:tripeptidyl-peptidase-1